MIRKRPVENGELKRLLKFIHIEVADFATSGRNNCYVPMLQMFHRDAAKLTSCRKNLKRPSQNRHKIELFVAIFS